MEEFADYFSRIQDLISRKTRDVAAIEIRTGKQGEQGKLQNLFVDCFDHHTACTNKEQAGVLQLSADERRFISRDSIIARYLDHWYLPPTIVRGFVPPGEEVSNQNSLSFNEFCGEITSFPITGDPSKTPTLGSNTYSYLVGDVGEGKSALIAASYRKILFDRDDHHGFKIIPIHLNVDAKPDTHGRLPQINGPWFEAKLQEIKDQIKGLPDEASRRADLSVFRIDENDSYISKFRSLARHLAVRKVRLLIYLDNVDRYHFNYSKYRFVEEFAGEQRDSVVNNLQHLIEQFTSPNALGWCGFCIVFSCRRYVYQYLRSACDDQSRIDMEFGSAFTIHVDDHYRVIRSRLNLFEEAVGSVLKVRSNIPGEEYLNTLASLFSMQGVEGPLRPEIELISRLGHHGLRSLIGFIDALKLDASEREVFSRLLTRQTKNLPIMYMLKLRRRFGQGVGHFPNIFLVDSQVARPIRYLSAHQPHRPTYWLKYFVLKYLSKYESRRFSQLQRLFVKIGGFDDHLFRLVLGSLTSTNESRCIDVDPMTEVNGVCDPELLITSRGRQLVSASPLFGNTSVDFCFEFSYLQLIVDDVWISVPKDLGPRIACELDYSYLFAPDKLYGERAAEVVKSKASSVYLFSRVLAASLKFEERHRHHFFEILRKEHVCPDFIAINQHLMRSVSDIESNMKFRQRELSLQFEAGTETVATDRALDEFFERVHKSGVLVAP